MPAITMPAAVAADPPSSVVAEDADENSAVSSPAGISPVSDSDKFIVLGGRKIVKKKKKKCNKCKSTD